VFAGTEGGSGGRVALSRSVCSVAASGRPGASKLAEAACAAHGKRKTAPAKNKIRGIVPPKSRARI